MHRRPLAIYESLITDGGYKPDPAQAKAIEELDRIWVELTAHPVSGWWARIRGKQRRPVEGLYMWGGVGRGKTWLMDMFFESLPGKDKLRIHFHRFMARIHVALKAKQSTRDPLTEIAREWASQYRMLCFDEFFVSDIADAMLLGGLFQALFAEGVTLIATSNVAPDNLYRNGLQRAKFLPAIESLKEHCLSLHVDGERDFRLRLLHRSEIFLQPLDSHAEISLGKAFAKKCHPNVVMINAIDEQHFQTVHRVPGHLMQMESRVITDRQIQFQNTSRVPMTNAFYRWVSRFYKGPLRYELSYWYGSNGVVTMGPDFLHIYIMFALRQSAEGTAEGQTLVFTKRRRGPFGWLFNRAVLLFTKLAGNYFSAGDTKVFESIRFDYKTPVAADKAVQAFMAHLEKQTVVSGWAVEENVE